MSGGGSCPTLGQGGEFIPPQGQIPISLCIFQLHPWALPSLLAPISHPIPPAHTKQIEPALHLDFFQASLIAQGALIAAPKLSPQTPQQPQKPCVSSLFSHSQAVLQAEGLIRMILPVCLITHKIFLILLRFGTTPRDLIDFFIWLRVLAQTLYSPICCDMSQRCLDVCIGDT